MAVLTANQVIPMLKKGTLGIRKEYTDIKNRMILIDRTKKLGEKHVLGKLSALIVFNKDKNPEWSQRCANLHRWLAGSFIGKRKVSYPKGFGTHKRRR